MENKEIIEAIAAMLVRFDALTVEDKAVIKQMCKDAGIKTSFNSRCKNCYQDALLLLKLHYGVKTPDADIVTPSGNYIYHNGNKKVVWWYRHQYTELSATSDDATIERYMAVHPLQTHFSRVVTETAEETPEETPENGTENAEQAEGGVTTQPQDESGSNGEETTSNEGEQAEGDNGTEGNGDEKD